MSRYRHAMPLGGWGFGMGPEVRRPKVAVTRSVGQADELARRLEALGCEPVIWPLIDAFCRAHPDVQPDVTLDDHIGNWVQDRADVGFRVGSPPVWESITLIRVSIGMGYDSPLNSLTERVSNAVCPGHYY